MKVTKVATRFEIEDLTSNGWTIVTTIANAQVLRTERTVVRDAYNDYKKDGQGYGQTVYVPAEYKVEMHPCIEPMFVVEREAEDINVEARLRDAIRVVEEAWRAEQRKLEPLEEQLGEAKRAATKAEQALVSRREQHDQEVALRRKLEADLAKVRKEIGEARWREILG